MVDYVAANIGQFAQSVSNNEGLQSTVDLQNFDKLTCTVRSVCCVFTADRTAQVSLSQFCRSTVL